MKYEVTPGWLAFHPNPSIPSFKVPAGAVDAHCHVFGPGDTFPYAPERKYTPCDASKEQLFALRDRLGFDKNVIVQATCHGTDNRALVDALRASNNRARGVATVNRDVTDAELKAMHDAGVRGTRIASRRSDGTSSSISKPPICRSSGTSSPHCRPLSSSITWAGRT